MIRQDRELMIWKRGWGGRRDFAIKLNGQIKRENVSVEKFDEKYWKYVDKNVDMYSAIFTDKQIEHEFFDTIFIDVDYDGIEGYNVMKLLVRRLNEVGLEASRVYRSGRGFHIYVDFEEPLILNRESYKVSVYNLIREMRMIDFVDRQVLGDVMRIARLPHTYNSKVGKYMVRVGLDYPFVKIEDYAKKNYSEDLEVIKNDEVKFEKFIKIVNERKFSFNGGSNGVKVVDDYFEKHKYDIDSFPECMKGIIYKLNKGMGVSHYERLHLVNFLILIGWSDDEIVEIYKNADDFKESYTRYQIRYSREKKLNPFNCGRAVVEGFCEREVFDKCPFNPLIKWVRW